MRKETKIIFKKIGIIILIISLFMMFNVSSFASEKSKLKEDFGFENNLSISAEFDFIYDDFNARYPNEKNVLKIASIKKLRGFGNDYYNLVEFNPSGYLIYNDEFSFIIESSKTAPSPYLDYYGDLIYLGFMNYYYASSKKNTIIHCENRNEIVVDENMRFKLENISNSICSNIENTLDKNKEIVTKSRVPDQITSVNSVPTIANINADSLNNGGNCGYVAGAFLIFYAARVWGREYLYDRDYIIPQLVKDIQKGRNNASAPGDLESALNDYMNSKGDPHNAKVNMWLAPSPSSIYDRVNEDKPVTLFCDMPHPESTGFRMFHAFVVYRVKRSVEQIFYINRYFDYVFTVHMGWSTDEDDKFNYNSYDVSYNSITIGGMVNLHKGNDDR